METQDEIIEPHPYQLEGARLVAKYKNALLADRMGLGKTAQAIVACDMIGALDITVICPAIAKTNWVREFDKFSFMSRPAKVLSSKKDLVPDKGVVVASYEVAVSKNVHERLLNRKTDVLIIDEAHYLCKTSAARTRRIYTGDTEEKGSQAKALVSNARKVICISGTPARNNAAELWPMLRYVFPDFMYRNGKLMDYWTFVRRYCKTKDNGFGLVVTGNKNVEELKDILSNFMIRRGIEDIGMQLPPLTFHDLVVEPGPVDLATYFRNFEFQKAREEFADQDNAIAAILKAAATEDDAIAMLEKAVGSTSTLRRYVGLSKVKSAAEIILQDLAVNGVDKMVVFAIHRDVIEELREATKVLNPKVIYGGTAEHRRVKTIDEFQNGSRVRLVIAQIAAAGIAITLTAASEVLFVESSYVPADNAQAVMRVHRLGQKRPVRARFLSLANSTDERVQQIIRRKTARVSEIFDSVT